MTRIARSGLFLLVIFILSSCSSVLVRDNDVIRNLKKPGLLLRLSNGSKLTRDDLTKNFFYWKNNFSNNENIISIDDASESLGYYKFVQERFYQLSEGNEFLKYKSIGVLNQYLQINRNEIQNLMSKHQVDCLIIFEVYSIISTEMQFFDYETVLAVVDSGLNIIYLDYNSDHFETENSPLNDTKNLLMDKINDRLISKLQDIKFLGERISNTSNNQPAQTADK